MIQVFSAKLDLVSEFGNMVRSARVEKNLSQRQLAQRIGKSASYINYVESGVNPSSKTGQFQPSSETVERIAKALQINVDDALLAAGYAPRNVIGPPRNRAELIAALERIGVEHIEFEENLDNSTPEELQELFEAVRIAVQVTLSRQGRKKQ